MKKNVNNQGENASVGEDKGILYPCAASTLCPSCQLFVKNRGNCLGCTLDYQCRCLKSYCSYACNICGGGKRAITPACCGRPLSQNHFVDVFHAEIPTYSPPAPKIKSFLIPIIFAQIAKYHIPESFPQIDAWAAPVHKVMNLRGQFRSADLKDYLGLPSNRVLILTTCAPDNYMEMLWQMREKIDCKAHGIDYWFPAHFSIYDNDSKFYQFYNAKRQQIYAVLAKSHFIWFRLGENIPVQFLNPFHAALSILISCQQMYSKRNRDILKREIEIADKWFPKDTSFFFVGGRNPNKLIKNRRVFWFNERWLILALKGRTLDNHFSEKQSIGNLLIKNLKEVLDESSK